jgi:hypothetical protein
MQCTALRAVVGKIGVKRNSRFVDNVAVFCDENSLDLLGREIKSEEGWCHGVGGYWIGSGGKVEGHR